MYSKPSRIVQISKWLLLKLHGLLLGLQRASLARARWVFPVAGVIFVGSVYLATHIQVGIRAEDWLDPHAESTKAYLHLKENFGSEDKLSWIVSKPWSESNVCALQTEFSQWKKTEYKLASASSAFDLRVPFYNAEKRLLYYPLVLADNCQFSSADLAQLRLHPLIDAFSVNPGKDFLYNFTLRELRVPTKWGTSDFEEADRWIQILKAAEPTSLFGGSLFFQKSTKDGIQWAGKMNFITALLILLCCRFFLGTWLSGLILVFLVFLTTSFLQAGMVLRKEVVDPLSSSLFILMAIAVIEDYFYVFHLTRLKKIHFRTGLRRMVLPGFLTSLTTALGFGALVTSDNLSVRNLGFWAAIGTMTEWALIFLLLPALTRIFPRLNRLPCEGRVWKPRWLSILGDVKPTRKGVLLLCLPLLLIFYTFDKVNINYTPFDMFPTSHPLVQFRDYLKAQRGFEGEVSLVFDKKDLTPEDSKLIQAVADHPLVAAFKDPYQIAQQLMPKDADPALQRLIRTEIRDTPSFKAYHAGGQSRALLFIRSLDIQSVEQLSKHAELVCAGRCHLNGEIIAFKDYAFSMLNTLYSSFVTSLVPVLLIMAFLCLASSGRILWPILLSTIWAPVMLLILVSVLQIKVNVVTCLAMALLTGLAGDNAIQFLFFDRRAKWTKGLEELKHSALLMFVVMTAISSVLLLSYFRSARILSGLIVLGIFLLLVGDLWILNHYTSTVEEPDGKSRE